MPERYVLLCTAPIPIRLPREAVAEMAKRRGVSEVEMVKMIETEINQLIERSLDEYLVEAALNDIDASTEALRALWEIAFKKPPFEGGVQ
ncbi:MAG: hypothetical protein WHV66_00325 [Anaerolineales bacterium]